MIALLSVSDKRGLTPLAQGLVRKGFRLLSTGGTLEALRQDGVGAEAVSEYTQSPEILGGRVKTLHPKIHGGILGRLDLPEQQAQMQSLGIAPISLVVVNLYPFRQAWERGLPEEALVEQIDIGGPSLLRAAAKNFRHCLPVVDPDDYQRVLEAMQQHGQPTEELRWELMRKAFAHTAAYDASISQWLSERAESPFPDELTAAFQKVQGLRYGENPHQRAAFYRSYRSQRPSVAHAEVLQGKELSYNNLLDLDAGLALVLEFDSAIGAAVIKHNCPCGVAVGSTLESAYRTARAVDETSAFGGIVILNRTVDAPTAHALAETFLEAVLAPDFSSEALGILGSKKNLRLLRAGAELERGAPSRRGLELRTVSGGLLVQDADGAPPPGEWKVVTQRSPSSSEWEAARFAWKVCKHVKSNAIVLALPDRMVAAGGGHTSRVDAVRWAVQRGASRTADCAAASDAFFPFRDGVDELAKAGVKCVVQPGGSVKDGEVVAAANQHGLAMVFTGVRHFRH